MARKRAANRPKSAPPRRERPAVTPERFSRLHRMIQFLAGAARRREELTLHLGLDVRGFYRDLEILRAFQIQVRFEEGLYSLVGSGDQALTQLPYPDPHLTLGEALQLAKGRSSVQRKLREQIDRRIGGVPE